MPELRMNADHLRTTSSKPGLGDEEAPAGGPTRRTRVGAIERAVQVLDHLQHSGAPAGAYAIARAISVPLSTAYAIVDELVDKQLLTRHADGTVWLGSRLYFYGLAYTHTLDFLDVAMREVHILCRETGETVQLCGRDGDDMVVLANADGPGHFRVTSSAGTRMPLNWTASGRLLIGHLPVDERVKLFQRCAKPSPTGRAPIDAAALAHAAGEAYRQRLSIQVGESDFSVACIASPIRDREGVCVATISIVLPEHKATSDGARYGAAVRAAAQRIEENTIGAQGSTATMASTSTVMFPGKELKPTADRA
ncbi:IclR family transcriptional regulator [Verminephrobacter aporrectodeae]|nr:IclR family transcriptional regulator [Verminephrobacter aporrectodeae]